MIHIGIDPGINGGIAILDNGLIEVMPCPGTVKDMADIIKFNKWDCLKMFCIIEKVHSMPGQGVASTFKFGKNFGQWLGILAAYGVPYREVSPQTWMKYYGAMPKEKTNRKNHIKHLAQSLYPNIKITLKTSDAVLLANWCREIAPAIEESAVSPGFINKDNA